VRFVLTILILLNGLVDTHAQIACGESWLENERGKNPSINWNDYLDKQNKKSQTEYFISLPSDVTKNVSVKLKSGVHYSVLFYTADNAQASGLEILNQSGTRQKFDKVYGKPKNNIIEMTFEPSRSDIYTIALRSIFQNNSSSCAALLVRQWDDSEWREYQRERGTE
jgi:hypothetical protein